MGARSILAIMFAVLVPFGAACSSQSDTQTSSVSDTTQLPAGGSVTPELADQPTPKPSPRDEWVDVFETGSLRKRCDGTTLLYYASLSSDDDFAVVPNSPECQES